VKTSGDLGCGKGKGMEHRKSVMELFSHEIFWDVRGEKLEIKRDRDFIIERVINYGSECDEKALYDVYKRREIREAVRKKVVVSGGSIEYICMILGIRKERCKCYKSMSYQMTIFLSVTCGKY
jgi:hypothetical protein